MEIARFAYNSAIGRALVLTLLFCLPIFSQSHADNKKYRVLNDVKLMIGQNDESRTVEGIRSKMDSLLALETVSDSVFGIFIGNIGEYFREQGKITTAVDLYRQAISCYDLRQELSEVETVSLISFYIPLGASHEELGMWSKAMEYYFRALSLTEGRELDRFKAMVYNNIGAVYYNRKDLEKAEQYVQMALEINKRLNITRELFNNYNNLAGIWLLREKYDQALDYALKAIQLLDSEKHTYMYYFMQSNIASLYLKKKEPLLALSYLRNAMIHQERNGFRQDLVQTYYLLSEAFEEGGRIDSARIYMDRSLSGAEQLGNKHIESRILRHIAGFNQRSGDFDAAYRAMERSVKLNDTINQEDNLRKITNLEEIYEADKKARENELLIKDIALQKASSDRLWGISGFVVFLLLVTILLLYGHSRNKEKERLAQELFARQQADLFEKEKELQKKKQLELNYTLDQRNRELTSYTLHMVKTNEFIADINLELKQLLLEINPKDRLHKAHLQQILNKLQQHNTHNNWDEFRFYFEQVHPSFYENLEKQFPELTIKERRLCAFLRLGLSSKDISSITFKEVRSVESARNRLRKKLGIASDGNLTEFLSQDLKPVG